jgi:outer membrane immunogenic protein
MKKLLVAIAAIVGLGTVPALAADILLKGPPVPVWSWTGFYVGGNFGYSFGNESTNWTVAGAPLGSTSAAMNGVLGGGQAGYNWQSGSWVFGIETDIQGTGQQGTATIGDPVTTNPCAPLASCPTTTIYPLSNQEKLPWFGTLRGRLGIASTSTALIYATGGLAYGEIQSNGSVTLAGTTATGSASTTRAGWTLGGGVEWAFSPTSNWSAKVEYLYLDLGTVNNTYTGVAPLTPISTSTVITDNIVRAGINYYFH